MKLSEFRGVDDKLRRLIQSVRRGNIMHAMIFDGPDGTGKRSMAEIMTRTALCESSGAVPCEVCDACRKCRDGVHPDVHVVDIEEDRKQIRIEQIRALQEKIALSSYEGGKKIVIIENADAMNNAAQNALLKTLEEPIGDTLFFLLTNSPGSLLPTIRSRCLPVHFTALEIEECAQALLAQGIERDRAQKSAAIAAGCVGRALEFARDDKYFALRDRVIEGMESIRTLRDIPSVISKIGKIKDSEMGNQILGIIELWAWDLMRLQNGDEPLQKDMEARLKQSKINGNRLLQSVTDAARKRDANIGWANILEPILYGIADARSKG